MPGLSAKEREDYLILLYFGASPKCPVGLCVRRAYLDFNRTLHGISRHATPDKLSKEAHNWMEGRLSDLFKSSAIRSQSDFDAWHKQSVDELCHFYSEREFKSFTVGQAQKWINMTLKYSVIFGEERIPGVSRLISYLHAPIDNVVLDGMELPDKLKPKAWSQIKEYAEYLGLQAWIRGKFPSQEPLMVEFQLWKEGKEDPGKSSEKTPLG